MMDSEDSNWLNQQIDKRIRNGARNFEIVNELLEKYNSQTNKKISRYALSSRVKRRRRYQNAP